MTTLADLKNFDLDAADVAVWVFRRPRTNGQHRYVGRWIEISNELADKLREGVAENLSGVSELIEYDVLAQNNEASALVINADETESHLISQQIMDPTPDLKIRRAEDLKNTDFCVVRFTQNDNILLAVRKNDATWSTKKTRGLIRMIFRDEELDIDDGPSFSIKPDFDFFVLNDRIFIRRKAQFESLMSYKMAHERLFSELTKEDEFAAIFADIGPLTEYVGTNKIHLRRAAAIQQKGHYKNARFMEQLRSQRHNLKLNIAFDTNGRIIATVESGRDIFLALLDHRLISTLTDYMYDVPNTEQVD
ncbi:Kiwa anti-phage protein KwaB-like domain-containing protein [Methylobacterium indicum]|uniref:Kiwa anti-phage protein KwaB-like domain-containing protein n=1 Tax=Methylobacterium indicum TaxID=1775910 RepID=UPI0009E81F26|nr:Kiwa anti-phage protein KwaB-like domain-containing protein [Methylobacterium indicum]